MSKADINKAKELKLISDKKYQKHVGQVKIKLDWLYN